MNRKLPFFACFADFTTKFYDLFIRLMSSQFSPTSLRWFVLTEADCFKLHDIFIITGCRAQFECLKSVLYLLVVEIMVFSVLSKDKWAYQDQVFIVTNSMD